MTPPPTTTDCPLRLHCASMTGRVGVDCPNWTQCSSLRYLARRSDRPRFYYNRDWQTRDSIIFGQPQPWHHEDLFWGGCKKFERLTLNQLQQLLVLRFADPNASTNSSPAIQEFLNFAQAQAHLGFTFTFEGYVVRPEREDYRVTVDAIAYEGEVPEEIVQPFQDFALHADELEIAPTQLRAWWD
jgi:hypothetical protein